VSIRKVSRSSIATGSKGADVWDRVTNPTTGNFVSIATATVDSAGASSITFSSIPQGYSHLQLRAFFTTTSTTGVYDITRFNGDTSASTSYARHTLEGDANSSTPYVSSGTSTSYFQALAGDNGGAYGTGSTGYPNAGILDILDYANTSKYKTVRSLFGSDSNNGYGVVGIKSGVYMSFTGINQITINAYSQGTANSFGQYSVFALYGVK
jgi:hypothetical protein